MAIDVYLAFSVFPRRHPQEEVWLTVQPYITETDLTAWLDAIQADGSVPGVTYHMLVDKFGHPGGAPPAGAFSLDDVTAMVPVPLAGDMSLSVGLRGTAGADAGGYIGHATNDRSGVVIIDDPDVRKQFERDNVVSSDRKIADTAQNNRETRSGAFAMTTVQQLSALRANTKRANDDPQALRARDMLTLAFLGGTVRRFRNETVARQNAVQLFVVDPGIDLTKILPPPVLAGTVGQPTSVAHVSAVGLMFRLDQIAPLAALRTLTGIDVWVHPHTAAPAPAATITSATENDYLTKYFAAFDFAKLPLADHSVTIVDNVALSNRAYVTQHLMPFAPVILTSASGSQTLTFRKPASPPSAAAADDVPPTLGALNRMVIRAQPRADDDPHASSITAPTIAATLGETLEVRLIPYRGQTVGGGAPMLFQLVPTSGSSLRFVMIFGAIARGGNPGGWPADCTLFTANGAEFITPDQLNGAVGGFVGAYMFAWDDPVHADPTTLVPTDKSLPSVLFWLRPPLDTSVNPPVAVTTIVLTLVRSVAPAITATFISGDIATADALGPRWEWKPPPAPQNAAPIFADSTAVFNSIAITANGYSADQLKAALVAAIGLNGDDVFVPARSATNVEGIITVRYPAADPNAPVDQANVDPPTQYNLALANYNKLNVSYLTVDTLPQPGGPRPAPDSTTSLNFWSEALAIYSVDVSPHDGVGWAHQSTFPYRYRDPLYAPDNKQDLTVAEEAVLARRFFVDTYSRLGKARQIFYDLEHTTGDPFALAADGVWDGGTYLHDLPPTIAADLRRLGTTGAAAAAAPFLTWKFDAGAHSVTVHVNADWLAPPDASVILGAPTSAWRAVAEIVSGTAVLRGRFRRFNFAEAAKAAKTEPSGKLQLSDGLLPVGAYEQTTWQFPASAIATFKSWLDGATPAASFDFHVTIGGAQGDPNLPPIATSCHVVELHLEVTRPAGEVPNPTAAWDLQRPVGDALVKDLFGPGGQRMTTAPEALSSFKHYLATVASGWATIRPVDPSQSIKLTGLFVGPEDDRETNPATATGTAGGEWTAPAIGANVAPGAPITASLLPLAFRPLAAHFDGVVSAASMLRLMRALGLVLDTAPGSWRDNITSVATWRGWFRTIGSRQPQIITLLAAAQATVMPAFNQDAARLDAEVATLVAAANGDVDAATGLRARIARTILGDPAQFANARAMLLTRLAAASPLPGDFIRLDMTRQIDQATVSGGTHPMEAVRLPLAATVIEGVTDQHIAFIETLGNAKYDDRFTLTTFWALGLEKIASGKDLNDPQNRLAIASTHLPGGVTDVPDEPTAGNVVYLPSRQPLVEPVHVWTASPTGFGSPNWWQAWDFGSLPLSRQRLLKDGTLAQSTGPADQLTLLARSPVRPVAVPTERDRGRVVAVFIVTSDESNEFINDGFPVQIAIGPADAPTGVQALAASANDPLGKFFAELDAATAIEIIDDLQRAIDPDVLDIATRAFAPPPLPDFSAAPCSMRYNPAGARPTLVLSPDNPGLEAFLFSPTKAPGGPTAHVLIVTYECDVWRSQRIGLGQTRNVVAPAGQPTFRKDLWQAAAITGLQKSATVRPPQRQAPASGRVQRNSSGMYDLVARGLNGAKLLQPEENPATRWATHDLSVTINGLLASTIDELYPDAAGGVVSDKRDIDHGRMPLHQFKAPAGSLVVPPTAAADPISWNVEYAEFTADFVWTEMNNNEILRIADVPIEFA